MNRRTFTLALTAAAFVLPACNDRGERIGGGPSPDPSIAPFRSAASCGSCHPQHLAEWEASMHAFAGSDPVMLRMAEIAAAEPGGSIGGECFECHAPALVRQQQWLASLPPNADPLVEDLSQDGVSCDVCHSIDIVPPVADISFLHDVDPEGPKLGGLRDPVPNTFHESLHDNSFATSIQCAPCHQVNLDEGTGLENTFVEWLDSLLSGQGIECQTCHMPAYSGSAALGVPARPNLHRHTFVGVDYAYDDFRGIDLEAQKDAIRALLETAVQVTTSLPSAATPGAPLAFDVTVHNHNSGHSIPSGTSFAREMWISVTVRDAAGEIYRSGWLEANADLVDPADDPDLAFFGSTMYDALGQPTFFTWRAASVDESLLLRFGDARTASYEVALAPGVTGPVTVELALNFRPVNPEMIRELELEELFPIEIFEMWSETREIPVRMP